MKHARESLKHLVVLIFFLTLSIGLGNFAALPINKLSEKFEGCLANKNLFLIVLPYQCFFHLTASATAKKLYGAFVPSFFFNDFISSYLLSSTSPPSLQEKKVSSASCYSNRSITWKGMLISQIVRSFEDRPSSTQVEESLESISMSQRNQINVRVDIYFRNYRRHCVEIWFCLFARTNNCFLLPVDSHSVLRFVFISKFKPPLPPTRERRETSSIDRKLTANSFLFDTPLSD